MIRALWVILVVVLAGCGQVTATDETPDAGGAGGGPGTGGAITEGTGGARAGMGGAMATTGTGGARAVPPYPACLLGTGKPDTVIAGTYCEVVRDTGAIAYAVSPDGFICGLCAPFPDTVANAPCLSPENVAGVPAVQGATGYLCVSTCTGCN